MGMQVIAAVFDRKTSDFEGSTKYDVNGQNVIGSASTEEEAKALAREAGFVVVRNGGFAKPATVRGKYVWLVAVRSDPRCSPEMT